MSTLLLHAAQSPQAPQLQRPEPGSPLRSLRGRAAPQGARRAFTLVELMAVVTIIGIFAAIAIPAAGKQIRETRIQDAAGLVAELYREAHYRAQGHGSAVIVRFTDADGWTVRERMLGAGAKANCAEMPVPTCPEVGTVLDDTNSRLIGSFAVGAGMYSDVSMTVDAPTVGAGGAIGASAAVSELEMCFLPSGAARLRRSTAVTFAPGSFGVMPRVNLVRKNGSTTIGLTRHVLLFPNGNARATAAESL